MSAYTPGPWRVIDRDIAREGVWIMGPGESGYEVATVADGQEPGQREANARLIAAAPAMFEALREILDWIEQGPTDRQPIDQEPKRYLVEAMCRFGDLVREALGEVERVR